jgi:CheY-like chemotaxis protein
LQYLDRDGADACPYPALPIILMSAYSTDELRTRGLDHSPVPLLTKPFTNEQLVAMVRSVLDVSATS